MYIDVELWNGNDLIKTFSKYRCLFVAITYLGKDWNVMRHFLCGCFLPFNSDPCKPQSAEQLCGTLTDIACIFSDTHICVHADYNDIRMYCYPYTQESILLLLVCQCIIIVYI